MNIYPIKLFIKRALKSLASGSSPLPLTRLTLSPRYQTTDTHLFGRKIRLPDAASYLWMHDEIFTQQIYQFKSSHASPLILDCGANIGLSIIYFKQLYPGARVIGFEPDEEIFSILKYNVGQFGLQNVELLPKGVWSEKTTLSFAAEGADGGRIDKNTASSDRQIHTVRLKDYLNQPIDLLKIDIEGAETEVLRDCSDSLGQVKQIFVEYHSFENQPQTLSEILHILTRNSFRYYIERVGMRSKYPFVRIDKHQTMDLQLNIWGYRI